MPSTTSYATMANNNKATKSVYTRPQRKSKMSVTQTYFLAHSARGKLSREAARADHDLRLLVGHANMLDSLMIDLANAEQEQEKWFNKSVLGADEESEDEEEEIQALPETIVEEPEVDWEIEDAQATDDDSDDEELTLSRTISHHSPPELTTSDSDSDSEDEQMPPSPENSTIDLLAQKERQALVTSSYYEVKETPVSETDDDDALYLPSRSQPTIIAAY